MNWLIEQVDLNRLFVDNITRAWSPFFFKNAESDGSKLSDYYLKISLFIRYFLLFIFFQKK